MRHCMCTIGVVLFVFRFFVFYCLRAGFKGIAMAFLFLDKISTKMSKVCLQGLDRFTSHAYLMKLYPHKVAGVSGNPSFHEKPGWCNIMIWPEKQKQICIYNIYIFIFHKRLFLKNRRYFQPRRHNSWGLPVSVCFCFSRANSDCPRSSR